MIYRKLTSSGDYQFGGGLNDFYSGKEAVGQAIYTSLRLFQGEWWQDLSLGLPLFQNILGQSGTPEHVRGVDMLIQECILGVQGVVSVSSFQSDYDSATRKYSIVSCTVQTQFGDVIVEGVTFG